MSTTGRGAVVLSYALLFVLTGTTAALAYWTRAGAGSGTAATTTVNPPASAAVTATGDTSSTVRISVDSAPAAGAPVNGYRVDRTAPTALAGACFITAATGSCSAAASGSGTQTFSVTSYRGTTSLQYWQSSPLTGVTGTPAAALAITGVARDGGNKKVHFTGTGAVSGTPLTVTICSVNSFPCAGGSTSSVTPSTAGSWTSGQSSANLAASQTYYARAVQGTSTSPVFTFSTSGL